MLHGRAPERHSSVMVPAHRSATIRRRRNFCRGPPLHPPSTRQSLAKAHRRLPILLRVWFLVPLTLTLVVLGGSYFTLPPHLCDEGMVLFMEGGCDWGNSNIYFFSKLGLLLAVNIGFALAWAYRVRCPLGFVPHLFVLAMLSWFLRSDPRCDRYYSHPNGSIGQMTVEVMAFTALGLATLDRFAATAKRLTVVPLLLAWNATHVSVFYLGLYLADHWTWTHTLWIAGTQMMVALALRPAWRCCST